MSYRQIVDTTNQVLTQYTTRLTIRQVFYRLVSPPYQIIPNDVKSYKRLVKVLTKAREEDEVDWTRIEDRRRRTMGGDGGFDDVKDWAAWTVGRLGTDYSEPMWKNQKEAVEVWVEKEALAAVVSDVAGGFRVLTFPTVGYGSFTTYREAVDRFDRDYEGKPVVILDFRDHDPSGLDMTEDVERRLRNYGAGDFEVERIALTYDQIQRYTLAPNPAKKADPRSRNYIMEYGDVCWELDALPPDVLSNLVREAIQSHVDAALWNERRDAMDRRKKKLLEAIAGLQPNIREMFDRVVSEAAGE